jgi:hypothetical protein
MPQPPSGAVLWGAWYVHGQSADPVSLVLSPAHAHLLRATLELELIPR